MTEYTGRYNCTARYPNDLIETVSWYVYFYPADGTLFQQCPLMIDQKPKCLVFYRSNVPFRVPCKALHPKVVVSDHGNVRICLIFRWFQLLRILVYYLEQLKANLS